MPPGLRPTQSAGPLLDESLRLALPGAWAIPVKATPQRAASSRSPGLAPGLLAARYIAASRKSHRIEWKVRAAAKDSQWKRPYISSRVQGGRFAVPLRHRR